MAQTKVEAKDWKYLIGGSWRSSGERIEIKSPFSHEIVGTTYLATKKDIEDAVVSAEMGFETMRKLASYKRATILRSIADKIAERKEEFARTITMECAKPIKDSRTEVDRAVNTFMVASEEAKRLPADTIPLDLNAASEGRYGVIRRFPVGPVLGITAFNFTLNLVVHKVAPAIAAGNSIVLKPANRTPFTSLLLAEVMTQVGVPMGAVNVVVTTNEDTVAMVEDDRYKVLTFTGGTDVGWMLRSRAGKKKVILELGGNAAAIVDETANVDDAAKRLVTGAFYYSGQSCISVQRIYVHKRIYDDFMDQFLYGVTQLNMGDPMDENTNIGPMITEETAKRVESWIDRAAQAGARVITGGKRDGWFVSPTVVENVPPDQPLSCQEAFGPVVAVESYSSFDEAVSKVNDSNYGLQAGIFTNKLDQALRAFEELEVGEVILNDAPTYRIDHMPYGGVKDSGTGREGVRYAIEEMTEMKMLAVRTV